MAEGMFFLWIEKHERRLLHYVAPAADEILRPDDAGEILEKLLDAQNHAHLLGLMMNVKPRDVEAIQANYQQPKDRLLHIIFAFLNQIEPMPTWRVIISALKTRTVNLPRLAASLEIAHFPDRTAVREPPRVSSKSIIHSRSREGECS